MIDSRQARETLFAKLREGTPVEPTAPAPPLQRTALSDPLTHFSKVLSAHHAQVIELTDDSQLLGAIVQQLSELSTDELEVSRKLYLGANDYLADLKWDGTTIQLTNDLLEADHQVALSTADCAIADTGTLVLTSGPQNPTRNNFLARHHFVVMFTDTLVDYSEQAWDFLQNKYPTLPRAVNFISGPSSSADVGLKLEYGAHGPQTLTVFLIGSGE